MGAEVNVGRGAYAYYKVTEALAATLMLRALMTGDLVIPLCAGVFFIGMEIFKLLMERSRVAKRIEDKLDKLEEIEASIDSAATQYTNLAAHINKLERQKRELQS